MESFTKLGLSGPVLNKIQDNNFVEPTSIQEKAIPLVLEGKDVIAKSETGSGKTLAFGLGMIQNIEHTKGIKTLVLTPTRELCEQVSKVLRDFSKAKKLRVCPVFGGVSINPQIDKLETADIVVATPGRLLDHIERGTINLSNIEFLVLDEADRMVDMGFIDDVKEIISHTPEERQTMLFSATLSDEIKEIERNYMKNPVTIKTRSMVDPEKLTQVYYDLINKKKFSLLVHLLKQEVTTTLIFCNTRKQVDFISKNLKYNGLDCLPIHGGFTQARRQDTMGKFRGNKIEIMVCTDVAARGLDIPAVTHVYNYDIPKDAKEYIHRIGRTARAGREGKVINLIEQRDYEYFSKILYDNPKMKIDREDIPKFENAKIKESTKTKSRNDDNGFSRDRPRRSKPRYNNRDNRNSSSNQRNSRKRYTKKE